MLEYLVDDLGVLVTETKNSDLRDDWCYSLYNGQLNYYLNEEESQTWANYSCPPDPLALGLSSEGLLLLTKQGYYRFSLGEWTLTTHPTLSLFFGQTYQAVYNKNAILMSAAVRTEFKYPASLPAARYWQSKKEHD